jgi:hypothetical protein
MSKPVIAETLPANVLEHPAVFAWSQVNREWVEPEGVEVLKRKTKSAVYRLRGATPDNEAIIAKRCRVETARVERFVYEELLPQLPVSGLRCYGFTEEPAGEFGWLFLENASGEDYSPTNAGHRPLAARWLADMHTAVAGRLGATRPAGLPGRGTEHYLGLVGFAQRSIRQSLADPNLLPENRSMLNALATDLDALEARWDELESRCEPFPPTLVHGDLVIKNVRLGQEEGEELQVFDWEYSGWGVPATDFAQFTGRTVSPDLAAYCARAQEAWGNIELAVIERLAACGKFFRLLDDIHWEVALIDYPDPKWISRPMSCLEIYERRLATALRGEGWV